MECTVLLADGQPDSAFADMNEAYSKFFGAVKPTRAAFYVKLIGTSLVEIKCSGWAPTPKPVEGSGVAGATLSLAH